MKYYVVIRDHEDKVFLVPTSISIAEIEDCGNTDVVGTVETWRIVKWLYDLFENAKSKIQEYLLKKKKRREFS